MICVPTVFRWSVLVFIFVCLVTFTFTMMNFGTSAYRLHDHSTGTGMAKSNQ